MIDSKRRGQRRDHVVGRWPVELHQLVVSGPFGGLAGELVDPVVVQLPKLEAALRLVLPDREAVGGQEPRRVAVLDREGEQRGPAQPLGLRKLGVEQGRADARPACLWVHLAEHQHQRRVGPSRDLQEPVPDHSAAVVPRDPERVVGQVVMAMARLQQHALGGRWQRARHVDRQLRTGDGGQLFGCREVEVQRVDAGEEHDAQSTGCRTIDQPVFKVARPSRGRRQVAGTAAIRAVASRRKPTRW